MISRSKAALTFSVIFFLAVTAQAGERMIRKTSYSGAEAVSRSTLYSGTLLRSGVAFTDSLLDFELLRIDSLYFSRGMLAASVSVDTTLDAGSVDISISIDEGERTRIRGIKISGISTLTIDGAAQIMAFEEGDFFHPIGLEAALGSLLEWYNNSGYPYAQVWLTQFDYDPVTNGIDISISVFEGERSVISRITFEGLSKTDSSFAHRVSRLETGKSYDEDSVERGRTYLRAAGIFDSVGEPKVVQLGQGRVGVRYPVEESKRANLFQGALGVAQRKGEDYVLSGAVDLELKHIGGTGRDAHLSWMNNGESYSRLSLEYHEPFLLGTPLALDAEVGQVIQDSVYIYHSVGAYAGLLIGPDFELRAGAAVDRNVPDEGELIRSIRQRYRLGISKRTGSYIRFSLQVEGGSRKSYLQGGIAKRDAQLLYGFDSRITIPLFETMALYFRLFSQAVFSREEIHSAEMYPLGGARSVRGYREGQFRGEKIAFANIEYWFGGEGAFFLFDDVGAFYRADSGWQVKNGLGFGLRSSSPVGILSLSFGLGDELSLRATRVHLSLQERF
jgi:outer membrane protein assembly factor BamA